MKVRVRVTVRVRVNVSVRVRVRVRVRGGEDACRESPPPPIGGIGAGRGVPFVLASRMKHVGQGERVCCFDVWVRRMNSPEHTSFSGWRMGRTKSVRQHTRFSSSGVRGRVVTGYGANCLSQYRAT